MADFCKACATKMFGKDTRDLAGLSDPENEKEGKYPLVLCEGCGPIQVDNDGNCISPDCDKQGQPGHGVSIKAKNEIGIQTNRDGTLSFFDPEKFDEYPPNN